ncbi:MAG TPA: hypothetical protein VK074_04975 [Fodinibius sp.]|nr:hypothetical protein [Fodinibius sp.]
MNLGFGSQSHQAGFGHHPRKRMFYCCPNFAQFVVPFILCIRQRLAPFGFIQYSIEPTVVA